MHPENLGANLDILSLVADYEAMKQKGETPYFGEETFFQVIGYYECENQLDLAIEAVDSALIHFSFSSDFYLKKAQLLVGVHRDKEALEVLQKAEIFAPSEPGIRLLRAEVLAYEGQHEEALALLADFRDQVDREELDDFFFTEAMVYECQSRFEEMYFSLVAALECNPDHHEALERLSINLEVTRKYEEAIPLLLRILDHNAYSFLAWSNLGHAYTYVGQYQQAVDAFEYAFLSNPSFEEAYRDCADLCLQLRQYQQALDMYKESMDRFGPDADLYFHMGQCYQALNQPSSARTLFQEALRLDPLDDEIHYQIGLSWALERRFNNSIRFFKQAIQLESKKEEYYEALGEAHLELGQLEEAEANYRLAIQQAESNPELWLNLALLFLDQGLYEDGISVLEESMDYTNGVELAYCKVALLLRLGRRQEGLYWLREALEEGFEMHYCLFEYVPELQIDPEVSYLINSYSLH